MWRIPFGELRIGDTSRFYINKALDKNWVSEGENVKQFEKEFADKFGYKYAIATCSGTDALICSCLSLYDFGARRGDEIIVPALAFVASATSILAAGFTPKFVDIKVETLNINPDLIEEAITGKTVAIMVVHTMGKPCEMDIILKIAKRYHLKVIEDCCEAHGSLYKGKPVGAIGDMGAFSFFPAHIIVCGEGGMVVTNCHKIADIIRSIKSFGRPPNSYYFDFQRIGYNSKMNDMEAAIGLGELKVGLQTIATRRENMRYLLILTESLSNYCYFPTEGKNEIIAPHAFWLVLKQETGEYSRTKLYKYLESRGIQCKTLFGSLPTQHKAFDFMDNDSEFPVAEYVGRNGLHFGIHQYLTNDDLVYMSETLRGYFV